MLRLFLRLYFFLMLPATVAFVGFMYLTDQVMAQLHKEQQRARAGTAFDRAERILTAREVPDWQGRLKEMEATFKLEHRVIPMEEALGDWFISGSEKVRLQAGEIAFRDRPGGGTVYLRKLRDGSGVLRIEWVGLYEYVAVYYTIILLLVTLGLAFILLRWVRPLYGDLGRLTAAADRVGEGDFAARAKVAKGSLVEPIAGAFNAMGERVQRLLESQRELEQGVAHELRTPLAQLKFDLELARGADGDAEREARFESMARDVTDLEELVNELLLVANLRQAPPYAPREVPARVLVDDVLRRAREEMRAAGRDVALEPPAALPEVLRCDGKYLSRALVNVVRNALRHCASRVALTVESDGARTTIHVDDDGPGIAPADRDRLFTPFTRLESARDRETGGVGLGLAIVKSVAEWHGGEARIADSPLGGARVTIAW